MVLKKDVTKDMQKSVHSIVNRYLDLSKYQVFIFGSRATGKGDDRSDIDIGIEGDQPVPPSILVNIKNDIDQLPILYKIDVVDFARVSSQFRDVAKKHIIILEP